MFEECPATLKMARTILKDGYFDETVHHCKIIQYIPEEERIYLLAGKTDLPSFSLDGLYECTISSKDGSVLCTGAIRERYWSKAGKVIVFRIENGFYKKYVLLSF